MTLSLKMYVRFVFAKDLRLAVYCMLVSRLLFPSIVIFKILINFIVILCYQLTTTHEAQHFAQRNIIVLWCSICGFLFSEYLLIFSNSKFE